MLFNSSWPSGKCLVLTGGTRAKVMSLTIVEGKIIVDGINYPVVEAKWARSQSNHGAWVVTLLSKRVVP